MSKKFIAVTIIVLVVALIGGVFWYTNQPASSVEEPEDDAIAVNSEPQQDTPEPEQEEPKENAPEAPEDNSEEDVPVGNKTVEEILAEAGLLGEPTEDDGTGEIVEGQDQNQEQQQQQQQGQGQGGGQQTGGKTPEQIADELRKIAEASGAITGDVPHADINPNIEGGGTINWG